MKKEQYALNFHASFAPEREALAQLLILASRHPDYLTKEEISDLTSIPTGQSSGKVVPHLLYAKAMGLITIEKNKDKYSLSLTPLGQIIYSEDITFLEELSQLLCHYALARKVSPTVLWSYLFNEVFPHVGVQVEHNHINECLETYFGKKVNLSPFRTCYFDQKSFAKVSILIEVKEGYSLYPHSIKKDFVYLYGYQLLSEWETLLNKESELTIDDVIEVLGFGKPYLWSEQSVLESLELLEEKNIVKLNRQLFPATVIRRTTSDTLLDKLYSLIL
jgi:hypothetical protein